MSVDKKESVDIVELKHTMDTLVTNVIPGLIHTLQQKVTGVCFDIMDSLYKEREDPAKWVINSYFQPVPTPPADRDTLFLNAIKTTLGKKSDIHYVWPHGDFVAMITFSWKGPNFYTNDLFFELKIIPKGKFGGPICTYTTTHLHDLDIQQLFKLVIEKEVDHDNPTVKRALFLDGLGRQRDEQLSIGISKEIHKMFSQLPTVKTATLLNEVDKPLGEFSVEWHSKDEDNIPLYEQTMSFTYRRNTGNTWVTVDELPFSEQFELLYQLNREEVKWIHGDTESKVVD